MESCLKSFIVWGRNNLDQRFSDFLLSFKNASFDGEGIHYIRLIFIISIKLAYPWGWNDVIYHN